MTASRDNSSLSDPDSVITQVRALVEKWRRHEGRDDWHGFYLAAQTDCADELEIALSALNEDTSTKKKI